MIKNTANWMFLIGFLLKKKENIDSEMNQDQNHASVVQLTMERELLLGQLKNLRKLVDCLEEENEKLSSDYPMLKEKVKLQEL